MSGKEDSLTGSVPNKNLSFRSLTVDTDSDVDPHGSTKSTPDINCLDKSVGREASFFIRGGGIAGNNLAGKKSHILCTPSPSTLTRNFGQRRKTILNTFQLSPRTKFNENDVYQLYRHTINGKGQEMYRAACEAYEEDRNEDALKCIRKALVVMPEEADYFVLRGDIYLQMCDYKSAIMDYKHVCILSPDNAEYLSKLAFIYYLQGQCYYDEELFLDALECFTRAAEMQPENSAYHSRSIACLLSLKRHKDCMKMINERIDVETDNPDLLILRARLHLLFSNPTLAFFDIKDALEMDPANEEADVMNTNLETRAEFFKERAIKLDMAGKTKEAIMKITMATDTNPEVLEYHILRAGMHRRNFDFNASVDDLLLAMDKCNYDVKSPIFIRAQKQLLLTFNDFAVDCFRKGYYEEAVVLLEKAIQGEKHEPLFYINRGDCFYKLNHLHFAMLDYQQAEEIDTDNKSVALRLSVVYNQMGLNEYASRKYYRSEDYFSLAIAHDCRNAIFYLSRARARYMQEKVSEAQVDVISGLTLDPSNKDFLSIFGRLYPREKVQDVLSSSFGQLVQKALEEVIEENFPGEGFKAKDVRLTKKKSLPQIDSVRAAVLEKIAHCMEDQEFHVEIIKGKKKVNELVETVIQSRIDLDYDGPKIAKGVKPKTRTVSAKT